MALFEMIKHVLAHDKKEENTKPAAKRQNTGKNVPYEQEQQEDTQEKSARVAWLTAREYMLYLLLLEGYTLKESAKQLGIKYPTANTHMTAIYKKLGVKSRAELIINYRDVKRQDTPSM